MALSSTFAQDEASVSETPAVRDVVVGIPKSFPPYYVLDDDGKPSGFAYDTMNGVAAQAGFNVTYQVHDDWEQIFEALRAGDIDIIPSLGISDHRKQFFAFTESVDTFRLVLFVRKDTQNVSGIADMEGRPVAVVSDNVGYRFLQKNHPDINIKAFPTFTDALFALLSAKVDAFVYPEPVAWKLARDAGVEDLIKVAPAPLLEIRRAMAVRKDRTELLAAVNQAVREFTASPEYQRVYVTWFGRPDPFWTVTRVVVAAVIPFILSLIVMGVWRYYSVFRLSLALRNSEARLLQAQEIAKIGHFIWDAKTNSTTYRSDTILELLGVSSDQAPRTFADFQKFVHSEDRERFEVAFQAGNVAETGHAIEYRLVRPDGETRYVEEIFTAEHDETGAIIRYVGTVQDITERKLIEATLDENRELMHAVINTMPAVIIVKDREGRIVLMNQTLAGLYGKTPEECLDLQLDDPYDAEETKKRDRLVFNTGQPMPWTEIEYDITGNVETWLTTKQPIKAADGTVKFVLSIALDVTDRKTLESQLRHAQRLEAMGQLTGGVAHDFNNLLAIMIGNAALLEDIVGEDDEAKTFIREIMSAVDRGASLTNRLLAFSRNQALSPVAVGIDGLIGGLNDMLRRTLGETIDLRIEKTSTLWLATVDPFQFENALVNLTLNARDAMANGGTLTITTDNATLTEIYAAHHEEVTPGDYVKIVVSDTGAGIPPEALAKAFEPFFTTKDVGKGSGLGLSMVFGFAKQSKGHVTIYSEVGHGTTVNLYIPRSEEDVSKENPTDDTPETAWGTERILVVEDDVQVRAVPANLLRKQGYDVVEAVDGKEAIECLQGDQQFDLLFTDVVLPGGMNGVDIAAKAERLQPGIKILFTSGYSENAVVNNGMLDCGATLLGKPYLPAKLIEKIREILDSRGECDD
jgi:PAS domain S-box-containing protein